MKPVEKLRFAVSRLLHCLRAKAARSDSSFAPKLPSPARRCNEFAEGEAVRTGAVQHFNRVHGVKRNGQVEVVMRGLAVVDAKAIQQHQGLLEGTSAQNHIRLSAARATLFEKDRRILTQQLLRRLQRKSLAFDRQHDN
jgi:hypothetical protein